MDYPWYNSVDSSLTSLWMQSVNIIPNLIVAVVLILVGYIIGGILKKIIKRVINSFHVNDAITSVGVGPVVERSGYKLDAGGFIGSLVKWFIILAFFVAALDILGLSQASTFIYDVVLTYLPKVIIATLIIFVGVTLAGVISNVAMGAARAANFSSPQLLARFAKFAIIFFAILAALNQLEIAQELVQLLFAGMVFALSLAFGLAFGLGGRQTAAQYLESMNKPK